MANASPQATCDKQKSARRESGEIPRSGGAVDFELLYKMYGQRVYNICLRMVRNTADAEDLTQDSFIQLLCKIDTFRGESAFTTWLYRLVVNVVLMRIRRKSISPCFPEEEIIAHDEGGGGDLNYGGPDTTLTGAVDRINLQRAITQLPLGSQVVFLLHDVEGYEHKEIAEMLRLTIGTSKSQLHKARYQLREILRGTKLRNPRRPAGRSLRDWQSAACRGKEALRNLDILPAPTPLPCAEAISDCETSLDMERPGETDATPGIFEQAREEVTYA